MTKKIIALFFLTAAQIWAQATASSTLQGTIYDSSHAVLPNTTVTLTSPATGLKRTENSNQEGVFRFNQLPADVYRISVAAPGFTTAIYERVEVLVGTTSDLNVTLTAGAQSDLITVDAAAPLIDTAKTEVSLSITLVR